MRKSFRQVKGKWWIPQCIPLLNTNIGYSCCVWGYVHNPLKSYAIYFFGVRKNLPIAALYGDMGWIPVCGRGKLP